MFIRFALVFILFSPFSAFSFFYSDVQDPYLNYSHTGFLIDILNEDKQGISCLIDARNNTISFRIMGLLYPQIVTINGQKINVQSTWGGGDVYSPKSIAGRKFIYDALHSEKSLTITNSSNSRPVKLSTRGFKKAKKMGYDLLEGEIL